MRQMILFVLVALCLLSTNRVDGRRGDPIQDAKVNLNFFLLLSQQVIFSSPRNEKCQETFWLIGPNLATFRLTLVLEFLRKCFHNSMRGQSKFSSNLKRNLLLIARIKEIRKEVIAL